jgi:hypothetical protein
MGGKNQAGIRQAATYMCAGFKLRCSQFHNRTYGFYSEICERCSEDFAKFSDDEHMSKCDKMCAQCATYYRKMAAM